MKVWNRNLYPPGGFYFIDPDKIEHRAGTLQALITKVAEYRVRRGIPVGNLVQEVNEFLCNIFPAKCKPAEGAPKQVVQESRKQALATRVAVWLRTAYQRAAKKQLVFVEQNVAQERAEICKVCPHFTGLPNDCAACAESRNHISFQIRAGQDKHTSRLRSCAFFGCDLRVAALLKEEPVQDAPEGCWRRNP